MAKSSAISQGCNISLRVIGARTSISFGLIILADNSLLKKSINYEFNL